MEYGHYRQIDLYSLNIFIFYKSQIAQRLLKKINTNRLKKFYYSEITLVINNLREFFRRNSEDGGYNKVSNQKRFGLNQYFRGKEIEMKH